MSSPLFKLLLPAMAGLTIAGCGGSGGGTTTCTGADCGGGTGPPPTTVTVTFGGGVPTVAAAKIGTGAFISQTVSGNKLTLSIPNGTTNYAVAAVCPALGTAQWEFVWEASTADGTSLDFYCEYTNASQGTLTGSLDASALPGVQGFILYSQNGGSVDTAGVGPDYGQAASPTATISLPAVGGNDRILVLAESSQGIVAAKNFTGQTVSGALNGGNTVTFTTADETTPETITYSNVPAGFAAPSTYAALELAGSGLGDGEGSVDLASQATTSYSALPASAIESGDEYFFQAATYPQAGISTTIAAGATNSGGPVTLTFPAPWTNFATPSPAALPSATFNYTGFSGSSNVTEELGLAWNPNNTATNVIDVYATSNYQAGSTTLAIPDLSSVPGLLAAPVSTANVQWVASIMEQSFPETSVGNGVAITAPLDATWSLVGYYGNFSVP